MFNKKYQIPNTKYQIPERGQSLFEIVIALALVGLILGLGTALITAALQAAEKARVQATASRLVQELMESASAIAGSSWHKIYCPPDGEPDGSDNCGDLKGGDNKYYATSTLMAYWPMDELSGDTAADTSGFGNTGTASGAAIVDGYAYKARSFNGTSDYVSVPIPQLSNNIGTFEEWVKPIGWDGGDGSYHGSFQTRPPGSWGNNAGQIIVLDQYDTTFYFRIVPDGGCCPIDVTFPAAGVFVDGQWTHIAATWNRPTNEIKVYINGELKNSRSDWIQATTTPVESTGYIGVGHDVYYSGIIDEVRIYNRALPQYEIQQHYLKAKDVLTKTPEAGTESLVSGNNIYTRWFTVENVSRALGDQSIESTSTYESIRDDSSTQRITVSITAQRFLATTSIVQYLTRSKNEAYRQTDWSCGPLPTDSPSPDNPCGYLSVSSTIIIGGSLELDTYSE